MDKNPGGGAGGIPAGGFPNPVNSILCHDAFAKEAAIQKIIGGGGDGGPVVLLDFDLLYTGYVRAGVIPRHENVTTYLPARENWQEIFKEVVMRVSGGSTTLIVDSLNGFFSVFDDKDSGRYANSCMMMMASCTGGSRGRIFLCGVAGQGADGGWRLHPSGRHVLENGSISQFFVDRHGAILDWAAPAPGDGGTGGPAGRGGSEPQTVL